MTRTQGSSVMPDTANKFMVGVGSGEEDISILLWQKSIRRTDALNLAAWLVVLADRLIDESPYAEFAQLLEAVKKT